MMSSIIGSSPQISVIVPVYKVERYLQRCIDSILRQTFDDFELILVDDGSPDDCGKICDEYSLIDNRIRVIHQENRKVSAARNAGLDNARGRWIAFVDSDDWIHRDYLKVLISGVKDDTSIIICKCIVTYNETEEDQDYFSKSYKDASICDIYADHYARSRAWGRLFRKDVIGELRYISGTEPAEDSCFNELLFENDMKFRITDAPLYYYYMRPDSAIHTHMGRGTFNSIGPLLSHLKEIQDKEKRRRIISRCYKYVFSARYGEMFSDDYHEVKKTCKSILRQLSSYLYELRLKDRIIIIAFSISPTLYRLWRIFDDPTLIQFEKNQRKRKKEQSAV